MVLPLPVLAPPIQSRPLRIWGIHAVWMGVGVLIFMELRVSVSHLWAPRSVKLMSSVVVVLC